MKKLFLFAVLPLCMALPAQAEEQDLNIMNNQNVEEGTAPDTVNDSYYYYRRGWGRPGYAYGRRSYCQVRCYGGYYGRVCRRSCYRPGYGWLNQDVVPPAASSIYQNEP